MNSFDTFPAVFHNCITVVFPVRQQALCNILRVEVTLRFGRFRLFHFVFRVQKWATLN